MVEIYGDDNLSYVDGDEGFVVLPGVVCIKESKQIYLALLELDLTSSGEHWGTYFLCKYGVIVQGQEGYTQPNIIKFLEGVTPYDYRYTAVIPSDFHVQGTTPKEITDILKDFKNHKIPLKTSLNIPATDNKSSVIEELKGDKTTQKEPPTTKTKKNHKTVPEH